MSGFWSFDYAQDKLTSNVERSLRDKCAECLSAGPGAPGFRVAQDFWGIFDNSAHFLTFFSTFFNILLNIFGLDTEGTEGKVVLSF